MSHAQVPTWLGTSRWLPCQNDTGETIPPFGIVHVVLLDNDGSRPVARVRPPNADGWNAQCAVNGPLELAAAEYGACTVDFPTYVAFDPLGPLPATGDEWGPVAGSCLVRSEGRGLKVLSVDAVHGRLFVSPEWSSGGTVKEGFLATDLPAPVGLGTNPTTGSLRVYRGLGTAWQDTGETASVINRDATLSLSAGTYVQVTRQGGEWRVIWAACQPQSSTGCGSATYRWTNSGSPGSYGTVTWESTRTVACGTQTYIWNGAAWDPLGDCTGVGCGNSSTPPLSPGVVVGQQVLRPCGDWDWYLAVNNCLCGGTVPAPPGDMPSADHDPLFGGTGITLDCNDGPAGDCGDFRWELVTGCGCGSASPPSTAGAVANETRAVPCLEGG